MEKVREMISSYRRRAQEEFLEPLIKLIKTDPGMYAVKIRITNHYYMGMENGNTAAFLYTDRAYAEEFAQGLRWSGAEAESLEIHAVQREAFFLDLVRSGFESIVLDKSHEPMTLPLESFVDEKETAGLFMNPSLMRAACQFYQGYLRQGKIKFLENQMCEELYRARFLFPGADRKNGIPAMVAGGRGGRFCPVFTDWIEFEKFDKRQRFCAAPVRFRELKRLMGQADGIVINPFGFGLKLDMEKLLRIEREHSPIRVIK